MKNLYILFSFCVLCFVSCNNSKTQLQIKIEQADKYCYGDGVEMDKDLAKAMYDSLDILEPEVKLALGRYCMTKDYGNLMSKIEGVVKFQSAAESGNTDAMWEYAVYTLSTLKNKDYECINYLKTATEEKNYIAMYWLGKLYLIGFSVEKDEKKAEELFKSSFNGLSKIEDSEKTRWENYYLSLLYLNGYGTTESEKEGKKYLKRSSDQGLPEAQAQMALYYLNDENVARKKEGIELVKKAAEQGNLDAQIFLSSEYFESDILETSIEKHMFWSMKAAAQGDETSAELLCSICYLRPDIAEEYWNEIADAIRLNALRGSAKCQKRMGDFYLKGTGVEQSYEDALDFYKMAAENGDKEAIDIINRINEDDNE